jgi:hypothetical protein
MRNGKQAPFASGLVPAGQHTPVLDNWLGRQPGNRGPVSGKHLPFGRDIAPAGQQNPFCVTTEDPGQPGVWTHQGSVGGNGGWSPVGRFCKVQPAGHDIGVVGTSFVGPASCGLEHIPGTT